MGMRGFQVGCNWDYEALLASSMARHPIIAPLPQVLEFGTVVAQRCLNFSFLKHNIIGSLPWVSTLQLYKL
jgi:hypothetical protein